MTSTFERIQEIDVSPLFTVTAFQPCEVDVPIASALATDGAFVATGLPESTQLDEEMTNLMRFFDLPLEVKLGCAVQSYRPRNPNTYRGYYPLPEESDWTHFAQRKEFFDMGPEPAINVPNIPGGKSLCEPNVWPNEGDLPNWRFEMVEQLRRFRNLACVLMAAIPRGLGLDSAPFLSASKGRNASIRLLSHPDWTKISQPACPASKDAANLGSPNDLETLADGREIVTSCHVDENLLSLLWQSCTGGLQMKGCDGTWKEVCPRPGTLSIHCGTLLTHLTDGTLIGTPHRVASDRSHRTAMGFFLEHDFEANVLAPNTEAPVTYAQHLVNSFPDRFTESEPA